MRARNLKGQHAVHGKLHGFTGDKKIDGMPAQLLIAGILQDDTVWFQLSSRAK